MILGAVDPFEGDFAFVGVCYFLLTQLMWDALKKAPAFSWLRCAVRFLFLSPLGVTILVFAVLIWQRVALGG